MYLTKEYFEEYLNKTLDEKLDQKLDAKLAAQTKELKVYTDQQIDFLARIVNKGFENVDKRFEQLERKYYIRPRT